MVQPVILYLENITKQFSPQTPAAVNSVNLKLHQGDILGLLGPSGCGKTTLLRLIAGFERPQSGTIELEGREVAGARHWLPPEWRDIGMVFQDFALFPHLTVAKNVGFGLKNRRRFRRYLPAQIKQRIRDAIALVGLEGLENRYPHELSGGQQQRVALARAIAPQPALVLLDEPLSNLDVQIRLHLRQEVRDILKQTDTSAIFVTHDQEEALSICDRVAVMRNGQIEQFGVPEAVYHEPASRFVAEFVTQANFLPAQWNGAKWETEVGGFEVINQSLGWKNQPDKEIEEWSAENNGSMRQMEIGKGETASNWNPKIPNQQFPDCAADLMIRQEDLHLEPDEAGTVIIRDRQFLGREHRYYLVTPSGLELHARTFTGNPLQVGTRVKLSVSNAGLKVFPRR